ncbi:hypothetical protein O4215_09770 [Rhodococcus maanshanensis]|uniref:hypothetical protein n=1 Tax=Rhodococcus maanshanensis TaxID=183556 RepID=UPI0022B338CA|nr:hypothetical protein [Rhodococcus maanshanensis]MCZ4555865.1 hypothetical protein [Rhodococcus maanshanensis]
MELLLVVDITFFGSKVSSAPGVRGDLVPLIGRYGRGRGCSCPTLPSPVVRARDDRLVAGGAGQCYTPDLPIYLCISVRIDAQTARISRWAEQRMVLGGHREL